MANKPSGNSGFSEDNGDGSSTTASGTELLESCHVLEHGYSDRAQPSEGDGKYYMWDITK